MKSRFQYLAAVAAMALLPWSGLVQSLPHHHADSGIPQEELACKVSGPGSQEEHLHATGHRLDPHPCLACLSGVTQFSLGVAAAVPAAPLSAPLLNEWPSESGSNLLSRLPRLRGPPVS